MYKLLHFFLFRKKEKKIPHNVIMYHYVEKRKETIVKNGKFREQIINKRNDNGQVLVEKKIYEGIVDKGKLRKKKVTFMLKLEYIEPGYEEYECNNLSFKKKKTKKRKRNHYKNRSLKK